MSTFHDPAYWRQQATEALRMVMQSDDEQQKTILREIAALYERLAAHLEDLRTK